MSNEFMTLDIQRFADGGAEGAGVTGTGTAGATAEIGQPQNTGAAAENAAENTSVAGEEKSTDTVTLDSVLKKHPELKKEMDKRTQKSVQSRVHQLNKSMQPKNDIIDRLMVMHGVKSVEELSEKLDSSMTQEFSLQNGMTEEMGREMLDFRTRKLQDERRREYYENCERAERQYQAWENEAKAVKDAYPDFDLESELENADFRRLISADERYRMPMKQIYEMLHHEELVKLAEKRASEAYSKSVNANLKRPAENGTGNQSAVSANHSVSSLTKKERAELAKRAQRGETITF